MRNKKSHKYRRTEQFAVFKYTKIMLVINQNVIKEKVEGVFFEINSQKINN